MRRFAVVVALLLSAPAFAHHGVAGVGAAALNGPGAPIESGSSATLPAGSTLALLKVDHAKFKTYDSGAANPEADYSQFWMVGVGHGFTPWFSAYVFAPYNRKIDEPGGFDTKGWADMSVMGQVGFKYDNGLSLVPANESLDDLEDWHFTVFAGMSFPTGEPNRKDSSGTIDPGKSTGFGKSSYTLGFTATKVLTPTLTFNAEVSRIQFQEYTYEDDTRLQFGAENRVNGALAYRFLTDPDSKFRLDGVIEAQYLDLGRDRTNGEGDLATGGRIVYLMPGVRAYWGRASFAAGLKKPVSTNLNEADDQQGAEGKEKYRLVLSGSVIF
jgi:hypothetical protein